MNNQFFYIECYSLPHDSFHIHKKVSAFYWSASLHVYVSKGESDGGGNWGYLLGNCTILDCNEPFLYTSLPSYGIVQGTPAAKLQSFITFHWMRFPSWMCNFYLFTIYKNKYNFSHSLLLLQQMPAMNDGATVNAREKCNIAPSWRAGCNSWWYRKICARVPCVFTWWYVKIYCIYLFIVIVMQNCIPFSCFQATFRARTKARHCL